MPLEGTIYILSTANVVHVRTSEKGKLRETAYIFPSRLAFSDWLFDFVVFSLLTARK